MRLDPETRKCWVIRLAVGDLIELKRFGLRFALNFRKYRRIRRRLRDI